MPTQPRQPANGGFINKVLGVSNSVTYDWIKNRKYRNDLPTTLPLFKTKIRSESMIVLGGTPSQYKDRWVFRRHNTKSRARPNQKRENVSQPE